LQTLHDAEISFEKINSKVTDNSEMNHIIHKKISSNNSKGKKRDISAISKVPQRVGKRQAV